VYIYIHTHKETAAYINIFTEEELTVKGNFYLFAANGKQMAYFYFFATKGNGKLFSLNGK
jgi:hypothetical protein